MADRTRAKYYLVEAGVLPEVFIKVTEARELLDAANYIAARLREG